MSAGGVIIAVIKENIPLGLFLLSTLITGNFLKDILIGTEIKKFRLEIKNHLSLSLGIITNFLVLAYFKIYIIDFSYYYSLKIWLGLLIVTLVMGIILYNYRIYGKKWITDKIEKIFYFIMGIILIFSALRSLPTILEIFNFKQFIASCGNSIWCLIIRIIGWIMTTIIILFIGYVGLKFFGAISEQKRYKKRKVNL